MKRIEFSMKVIGIYQIVGGAMAFVMSLAHPAIKLSELNETLWTLLSITCCSLSIVSGVMLLLGKSLGFQLTWINQLVQIPQIAMPGFIYRNVCGLGVLLGVDLNPAMAFRYQIQPPHFSLYLNIDHQVAYRTFNIMAVILAYYTVTLFKKHKQILKEMETESFNIGR